MIAGRKQIAALIPHADKMCLLDEVVAWDAEHIRCVARSHRDADNPMRSGGELAAVCGIEYAAQAMALHGRLSAQAGKSKSGYLASVRDVVCHAARLDELSDELVIETRRLMGDDGRAVYEFSVAAGRRLLLQGRAAVLLEERQG